MCFNLCDCPGAEKSRRAVGVICGMPQSLDQSTCEETGSGEVAWHCGQLSNVHNPLYQGGFQTVFSKGTPLFALKFKKLYFHAQ